ncbi:hypothetical protein NEIELOOT_01622 [Neisseria elongata subsp. glycolytica ATCC 29315]|uniref:Uncharacterized protein n=1 Tax=Neisseria elongata subsp. glycolytica ATCC 29315 TaxID=546263 RepID=D4DRC8_NEIEG|nr:hypothetical protein NEIELOOT_01622 [Neisseria elongata subsp. glycolytica ATCC 29315]
MVNQDFGHGFFSFAGGGRLKNKGGLCHIVIGLSGRLKANRMAGKRYYNAFPPCMAIACIFDGDAQRRLV